MSVFNLEGTPRRIAKFNQKSNDKYGWLDSIPWDTFFGINPRDGIEHQEILNLQNAAGVDADGLVGLGTLRSVQEFLYENHSVMWNPITGICTESSEGFFQNFVIWNGLRVPTAETLFAPIHTFDTSEGIDLHPTGSFSQRSRDINSIIVHWGGLNPQHLGRVFSNRKASSHFAVGISERTGEVGIYQYLDTAHVAWHAVGANANSIGIDICQQPELKHLGYYINNGYDVSTIENPSYPEYGPAKIISLDPRIEEATLELLNALKSMFDLPEYRSTVADGKVSKDRLAQGGTFSHFNVDFKGQGKWDVAPWWDGIFNTEQSSYT